jgi:hypothetical protein
MSQVWTGTPFRALLTLPVMGVSFTGTSGPVGFGMGRIGLFKVVGPAPLDDEEAAEP